MSTLNNYGLARFNKKNGSIDTVMTAIGKGLIQMWALQNTPNGQVCTIVNIDERMVVAEYEGTPEGFPLIRKEPDEFDFDVPEELFDIFEEEITKRKTEKKKGSDNNNGR